MEFNWKITSAIKALEVNSEASLIGREKMKMPEAVTESCCDDSTIKFP